MTDTVIDLIRHGEPVGGRAYRGHRIDDPLSDKGWQQMRNAVGEQCPWTHIISSPLQRCQAFADELAARHGLTVSVDERLKEIGFGEWEGQTPEQLKQHRLDEYLAFYADPVTNRPPGAEDLDGFIGRVIESWQYISQHYANKHVLVVAHAGVIRAVLAHVLLAPPAGLYRIKVENAGISRVRIGERGPVLEFQNRFF